MSDACPKRIQMSRQHPWRADNPDAIIVSRGAGIYGNPFRVGGYYVLNREGVPFPTNFPMRHAEARLIFDSEHAVELFRRHVDARPDFQETIRRVLVGHDLACWCPLDQLCHADVLLELANGVLS